MKNLGEKIKIFGLLVAALGLIMSTVACDSGKKSSRNRNFFPGGNIYDPYYIDNNGLRQRGCVGCPYSSLITDAVGIVHDSVLSMELGLSFYGDQSLYGPQDYFNQFSVYNGGFQSGMVEAQGTMFVNFDQSYYCPLPNGQYVVNTVQPGQLTVGDWTTGLIMVAQSQMTGVQVYIEFSGAISNLQSSLQTGNFYTGIDRYQYPMGLHGFVSMQVNMNGFTCMAGGLNQYTLITPEAAADWGYYF